jgi:large subunit ribosomal protein L22
MQFRAIARYIKKSPYKLRPLADVIRGKNVAFALDWLEVYPAKKRDFIKKAIESAAANAKDLSDLSADQLFLSEIKIDQGPTYKYHRPSAQGRSAILRKRQCHITVVLEEVKG